MSEDGTSYGAALLAVAPPPSVIGGSCYSGPCLSGRSLNVTRRDDVGLGNPRKDALVDTCKKTVYSTNCRRQRSGNTQSTIYQLQYCTALIAIPSQPSDLVRRRLRGQVAKLVSSLPSHAVQTQQTTQASILAHLAASPCTTGT